jgi:hypothetical protein
MNPTEETITPQDITTSYTRSHEALYGYTPQIRHMSGYWYQVNGEIVHRSTLTAETLRLRQLVQKRNKPETGLIHRLIARLKTL